MKNKKVPTEIWRARYWAEKKKKFPILSMIGKSVTVTYSNAIYDFSFSWARFVAVLFWSEYFR